MVTRALALALALAGCSSSSGPAPSPSASTAAPAASAIPDERTHDLHRAELRRNLEGVTEDDLHHRRVGVRRQAVRALARMRRPEARPRLIEALRDEDDQVVAWAAYGLGEVCAGARDEVVRALAAMVALRASREAAAPDALDPRAAMARAIGRCGTDEAEATLARWVGVPGSLGRAAIAALGDVGKSRKRLREETLVALLARTEGDAEHDPMPFAFYPLSRVQYVVPSVTERVIRVARKVLPSAGDDGVFIVQALGKLEGEAFDLLVETLASDAPPATRVHAARGITRFGRKGQRALATALEALTPKAARAAAADTSSGAIFVPLEVLSGLTDLRRLEPTLKVLAELEPPEGAGAAVLRRFAWLRCRAAGLRAERDDRDPLLRGCDPTLSEEQRDRDPIPSSIAARIVVGALGLDAVRLSGRRLATWRTYAMGGDGRARQKALRQLTTHDEVPDAAAILAAALETGEAGLVATAAEVLAERPARGRSTDGEPVAPAIADALAAQLAGQKDLEAKAALLRAAAALKLEAVQGAAVAACHGPHPALHAPARGLLQALQGPSAPRCAEVPPADAPAELDGLVTEPTTLTLQTEIGPLVLHLDPRFAPAAVTRVVNVAKGGFYDGNVVHRTVPGFVAQFGSPTADGYGGLEGLPALPCETSPVPFTTGQIGVALAGRDTGSTQLFVTLVPTPHLDGQYAWLGTVDGPWDALIDGDRILEVALE